MPAAAPPAMPGPRPQGDARLELAGGLELKTPFGTFVPPNISQDPKDGIGAWSVEDLANAMLKGVSPSGEHLYPAFPYTSYARMKPADMADLYAFLKTLPAVAGKAPDHSLELPVQHPARHRPVEAALSQRPSRSLRLPTARAGTVLAGRYLVEGPGHCGECHTPRDFTGGVEEGAMAGGAVAAEGDGIVPNITIGRGRHRRLVGRATSPTISRPASRRISIPSAAPWSRSSATWPS